MAIRYTKSNRATVFWSRTLASLVVLFPLSLSKVDFRSSFSRGLAVSAQKSSPAFAAFEDLGEDYGSESTIFPENEELLAAGEKFDHQLIARMTRQRQLALKGMVLRTPDPIDAQPIAVAGEKLKATPVTLADYHDPSEMILALPTGQKVAMNDVADPRFKIPTVADLADQLVHQEVKLMAPANRKVIQTETGSQVLIGGQIEEVPDTKISKKKDELPEETPSVATIAAVQPPADQQRPLWLNGHIEMTGGLAFVGPETQVVVKRVLDGETFEQGRVWVTEGKFEIYVKKPVGYLVAELHTREGRLLGRGEMNLVDLRDVPANNNRIHNIRLALRPMTDGASFRAVSGYSHGQQHMPVREARVEIQSFGDAQAVDDEGVVIEPSLDHESSFVVRAQAKNHWSTLAVGQAGQPQDIRLFSNNLIEALVGLGLSRSEKAQALESSIVWGQVMRGGRTVSGVTVEMAGAYQPIYFNDMYLPDPKLKATSANGLFAFLKVRPGVQALRVKGFGRVYPAQVFPTEAKHVSYVEVEVRDKMVSQFKVIDVMELRKPVEARVRLVGTDEVLSLSGEGYVEYSVAANPFMVEAEAGPEYEISRVTLSGQPHLVHVPLVKREWLHQLQIQRGVPALAGRGTIVGFIDDSNFEIELTGYGPRESAQIIYFDARGKVLNSRHGVAGGGFVIFNAPPGLQTVYVHPMQSRETHSQVVVAEPEYVHVVTWSAAKKR